MSTPYFFVGWLGSSSLEMPVLGLLLQSSGIHWAGVESTWHGRCPIERCQRCYVSECRQFALQLRRTASSWAVRCSSCACVLGASVRLVMGGSPCGGLSLRRFGRSEIFGTSDVTWSSPSIFPFWLFVSSEGQSWRGGGVSWWCYGT